MAAVAHHHGDAVCRWATHRHDMAPCGGDPRRLRRLLLLPSAAGTQVQWSCRAIAAWHFSSSVGDLDLLLRPLFVGQFKLPKLTFLVAVPSERQ